MSAVIIDDNDSFEDAEDLGIVYEDGAAVYNVSIDPEDDVDYYKFTVSQDGIYTLMTDGAADGDTQLYLYNSEKAEITYNDDVGGSNFYSAISVGLTAGETYYAMVQSWNNESLVEDYSFSISMFEEGGDGEDTDGNVSFETAEDLDMVDEYGVVFDDASIDPKNDVDYYKFTVSQDGIYTLMTDGVKGGDTQLYLYNSEKAEIAYDDDVDDDNFYSAISAMLKSGETYYAMVQSYDNNRIIQDYSLTVNMSGSLSDADDLGDISSYTFVNVDFDSGSEFGLFKFTVAEDGVYSFDSYSDNMESSAELAVYDKDLISLYDGNGEDYVYSIDVELKKGSTYYLQVSSPWGENGECCVVIKNNGNVEPDGNDTMQNAENLGVISDVFFKESEFSSSLDVDYYKFTIESAGEYQFGMTDGIGVIYTADGEVFTDELYDNIAFEAGDYYLSLSKPWEAGEYFIGFGRVDAEIGDDFDSAADLGEIIDNYQIFNQKIDFDGDKDFYKFTVSKDSIYLISDKRYGFDKNMVIYDENRNILSDTPIHKSVRLALEADKTYYICISGEYNAEYTYSNAYSLLINDSDVGDTFEDAADYGVLISEDYYSESISSPEDKDFFSFCVTSDSMWTTGYYSDENELSVSIYDYDKNFVCTVAESDGEHAACNVLNKGLYYLKVEASENSDFSNGAIDYEAFFHKNGNIQNAGTIEDGFVIEGEGKVWDDGFSEGIYKVTVAEDSRWHITIDVDADGYIYNEGYGVFCVMDENLNLLPSDLFAVEGTFDLSAGTYYVNVNDLSIEGNYTVSFDQLLYNEEDNNDTFETAEIIGPVEDMYVIKSDIADAEDVDYFKFTITEDCVLEVNLMSDDTIILRNIFNENYESFDFVNGSEISAGEYYLKLNGHIGDYTVTIKKLDSVILDENESFNSAVGMTETEGVFTADGVFEVQGDTDYYSFTATEDGTWYISADDENIIMNVWNENKVLIGSNIIENTFEPPYDVVFDPYTVAELKDGQKYYVSVFHCYHQKKGDYSINVSMNVPGQDSGVAELESSKNEISWGVSEDLAEDAEFNVIYEAAGFAPIEIETTAFKINIFGLPKGTAKWQVKTSDKEEWSSGAEIVSENASSAAEIFESVADGNDDLFFGVAKGVWGNGYAAQHVGFKGEWEGLGDKVALKDKNKIVDIFCGSEDSNILLLSDSDNGDALFVDDIFSAAAEENRARISNIYEVRAGKGDDIVDFTSDKFTFVGGGVTIRGGEGNDVIWASNSGSNYLFGDEGNDNIVGGSNKDIISGGSGNDILHGAGGDDIFVFSGDWGEDTVIQLDGENDKVTLWFAEKGTLDEEKRTYTVGDNVVDFSQCANYELKFGDEDEELYNTLVAEKFI